MRIDRIAGGMALGIGITRLITGVEGHAWFTWAMLVVGVAAIVEYWAEKHWPNYGASINMTNEERIADCERRIAEKEQQKGKG